ncbi:MAG: hypothetical protein E6J71_13385 [Deltaproteobacteria bacterium]|nr:MAG: hypothetical protein E6J81_13415 [Deltaproteobacteria bacterium]TMA88875.1 MAG: hypothetical protein E6J77_08330 [Deltaproteobacteria bacterium]TMB18002.1 MAG: hypothetical protein E6J71_13385 [Deltaproteobacteria bacterium]
MRVFAVVMLTLSAMGCTSEFRIKAVDSTRLDDYKKDGVNGVLFYQPQYMKTTYVFTTLVDKKGAVVGEAEKKTCTPVIQKEEIRIMPDFDHPWVILSEPSMFARGQFSVGLSNGMLASVNSESTPQFTETLNAVAALTTAAAPFAAFAELEKGKAPPACNAGPRLASFAPVPSGGLLLRNLQLPDLQ